LLNEQQTSDLFNKIEDDAITLVGSSEDRPRSLLFTPKKQNFGLSRRSELTLARFALNGLLQNESDDTVSFISESDLTFIHIVFAATKDATSDNRGFAVDLSDKGLKIIPEHWIQLMSYELNT
jgi:hypothetical protein